MLKRGSLIVVALASLGVIVFTQLQVRPKIRSLLDQRDQDARRLAEASNQRLNLERNLQQAQNTAAERARLLSESQSALAAVRARLQEQGQVASLQTRLTSTQASLTTLERQVAEQGGLANQLANLKAQYKQLDAQKETLAKRILELEEIVGPFPPPPSDLRAKVLTVDPKWGFVVLDLGRARHAKPTWNLLVHRNGVLVGKVQISTVLQDRCIANLLPGWNVGEVREGDEVLPETLLSSR